MLKDFIKAFINNLKVVMGITLLSLAVTVIFFICILLIGVGMVLNPLALLVIIILVTAFSSTLLMDYNDIRKKHKEKK